MSKPVIEEQVQMPKGWVPPSRDQRERVHQENPEGWRDWPKHMRGVLGLPADASEAQLEEAKRLCDMGPSGEALALLDDEGYF